MHGRRIANPSTLTALAVAASAMLAAGGTADAAAMTKQTIKVAAWPKAICNDGTPPIFYFSPGSGDDRNKWVLFLQGGAGCMSDKICQQRQRQQKDLVTGSGGPATRSVDGLLSSSKSENPDFANFTHVYVHYCSSDFWAGDGENKVGGSTWQFRGHEIIDALLDQLLAKSIGGAPTLAQASEVLVAGTSAGGMGVHNNLDHIAERLPNAKVRGLADSGWIPADVQPLGPGVLEISNFTPEALAYASDKPDASCAAANAGHEADCLKEGFVFPYIATPMFVFADQRDPVLLSMLGIVPGQRTGQAEKAYVMRYGQSVRQSLHDVSAYFVTANTTHTALLNARFSQAAIGGQTLAQTIGDWYFGRPGNLQLLGHPGEGKVNTHEAQ
jgi:O-palmitoleoyl-L-serine hydrolase